MNSITVYNCPICFDEHTISPFEVHSDDEADIAAYECGECDSRHKTQADAEVCCTTSNENVEP